MIRIYILVYSDLIGNRETVKTYLDSMPEVLAWRYDMPNCFYMKSRHTAQQLTDALVSRLGESKRFLFAEITTNRQGYLPKDTWGFLKS